MCNGEQAWVSGRKLDIAAGQTIFHNVKVLEPVGQPAGATADCVFIEGVIGHRWASTGQAGDGVDEGAAALWEVNPS